MAAASPRMIIAQDEDKRDFIIQKSYSILISCPGVFVKQIPSLNWLEDKGLHLSLRGKAKNLRLSLNCQTRTDEMAQQVKIIVSKPNKPELSHF